MITICLHIIVPNYGGDVGICMVTCLTGRNTNNFKSRKNITKYQIVVYNYIAVSWNKYCILFVVCLTTQL
jgi:hypothetical protein